ncbi:MAG: hypothetical protein HUU37_01180 [Bdellovibrionales bacterium]|nr:hypothetical protein [Bdellovibrionales bacterium]
MAESEEKKFLHDIAGTLATAIFVLEMALESMRARADVPQDGLAQVAQTFDLLGKMRKSVEERRRALREGGNREAS